MKSSNVVGDCSELELDECDILVASPCDRLTIIPSCISCGHVAVLKLCFSIELMRGSKRF